MNFLNRINFLISSLLLSAGESAQSGQPKIDFAVGGQAVIEGVMMRSPNVITIAVRKADKSIKIKKDKYQTITQRYRFLNIPIIRGVINLFEMMVIGTKAINFSANEMLEDELNEEELAKYRAKRESRLGKAFEIASFIVSLIFALALSIFLFKFAPLWIATFVERYSPYISDHYIAFNAIDGLSKITIFILYIYILSLFPSFKRIFEYHGAEHKSIFAYENKLALTVPNAKKQSRFHPRCGTSFILIVFTISILVYTVVPKQDAFIDNLLIRVALLPLIAGISYEYLKISARYVNNAIVKALVTPGLWFQRLTTREPKNDQLEVGLASLKAALEMEK